LIFGWKNIKDYEVSQIRLLIFHPAIAPYRIDLFNELANVFDLKVVFFQKSMQSQKFDQRRLESSLQCKFDYLCSGFNIAGRTIRWGMGRLIKEFDPDVVVCTEYAPPSLVIAAHKKFNSASKWGLLIWTSDNVYICQDAKFYRRLARKIVLKAVDGMIIGTHSAKKWYVRYGLSAERIAVCSNIQEEQRFRERLNNAIPLAKKILRQSGLEGKRIVMFVGRLVPLKGVDRVIRAFAKISRSLSNISFVIVGDGQERTSLEKLAADLGVSDNVKFVGRYEGVELMAWYLLGQVFVLASNPEAYGAVVNEALLAGMPVLCSSWAGATDLVREGQNGYIIDPYDISSIAKQMAHILAHTVPIQTDTITLKKNLMPVSFYDGTNEFIRIVKLAAQQKSKEQPIGSYCE
jgi:glycosyltransferase involved in cell wall biosynthesis